MRRLSLKIIGLLFIAIGIASVVGPGETVHAEKKEVKYFNISFTEDTCGNEGLDWVCHQDVGSGTVKVEETNNGYKISGDTKLNRLEIAKMGNGTLQVMMRGLTTGDSQVRQINWTKDFSSFRSAVYNSVGGTQFKHWGIVTGEDYYNITVGELKTEEVEVEESTPTPATTDPNSTETKATCMNSGGSGTLGWIVCTVMEWLGSAANGAYKDYVEPSLQLDPKLFEGGDDGTRGGWETFRNIANILFIIMFLFVIFSQITGVGIDNYGIKKILPKLIVAAILINLSYWICLVCVDLSNILGNSFQALFDSLGSGFGEPTLDIKDATVGAIPTDAIVSVGVLGVLVVMIGSVWANPAIVLSLLVAALGVVISIFFLFILLSTRQAAIIVLTVLSPLAVVCYMLPNTKSLFDKWLKLFEALLLVYPICGLLVGGGNYVSRLLLSAGFAGDGFFKAFTAMIVGIVPIFFIPTVLKGSFSAMGSLGAKISGIGQKVSGTATSAARNSQGYRNAQERGMARRTRIAAGLNREGKETSLSRGVGRVMNFGRGGKKAMAGNRAQYLKNQDALIRADALSDVGYDAARIAQENRAKGDEIADYMMLVNDGTRNGENEGELMRMFNDYMDNGNTSGAVAVARIAGRRKDTAARFMEQTITNPQAASRYDSDMMQAVSKEMTTGENSGSYRSASPLGFEFAAQTNRGAAGTQDYASWVNQTNDQGEHTNINGAVDNFVTNSQELVGIKNGSLEEIAQLMESGQMGQAQSERLSQLARDTIRDKGTTGVWDSTKADNIQRIANWSNGAQTPVRPINTPRSGVSRGNGSADGTSLNVPHNH